MSNIDREAVSDSDMDDMEDMGKASKKHSVSGTDEDYETLKQAKEVLYKVYDNKKEYEIKDQ